MTNCQEGAQEASGSIRKSAQEAPQEDRKGLPKTAHILSGRPQEVRKPPSESRPARRSESPCKDSQGSNEDARTTMVGVERGRSDQMVL